MYCIRVKNILTLVTIGYSWCIDEYRFMGPRDHFYPYMYHVMDVLHCWDRYLQVLYLGRALRTKETMPDFLKWRQVTRHPLVFRGLTGSQRTPGFGASH